MVMMRKRRRMTCDECVVVLQRVNEDWVSGAEQRTTASFLSSRAVDCDVPRLRDLAANAMDFLAEEQPFARWEIKVCGLYTHEC